VIRLLDLISLRIAIIQCLISGGPTVFHVGPGNIVKGSARVFPARYQCQKLIYYEHYRDIRDAIARESQLKKWSHPKKIALINRMNPRWLDLGAGVYKTDIIRDFSTSPSASLEMTMDQ